MRGKHIALYTILMCELGGVGYYFMYAPSGLNVVSTLHKENSTIEQSVRQLSDEVADLQQQVDDWQQYPFYTEQYAREQLHMARPQETIYLID